MGSFKRYGVYVVPDGTLYRSGAEWLGWDADAGRTCAQPEVPGLPVGADELTATPRKYGFHGTIKPPFVLEADTDAQMLGTAVEAFCAGRAPVTMPALQVRRLGSFIALTPEQPSDSLSDLAASAVRTLDSFRAAPSEAELARRRKAGLSERQEAMLQHWGYPYVMEEFRFHMTLTGRTKHAEAARDALAAHFAPVLSTPFVIASLALMGEDADGAFHLIHRYPLSG